MEQKIEQPNTKYIKELSGDDKAFEDKFISILKLEFPEEFLQYLDYIKEEKLKPAAEVVHKLKHKFNILGMENSYKLAVKYEEELKYGNAQKHREFVNILKTISDFIKTL